MNIDWSDRSFGRTVEFDESLSEIVCFYLWNTPVQGVSAKSSTFASVGIVGSSAYTSFIDGMKHRSATGPDFLAHRWKMVNREQVVDALRPFSNGAMDNPPEEFAIYTKPYIKTLGRCLRKTEALFYMIRNSIAHGSFYIVKHNNDRIYIMQTKYLGDLRGRALIYERSLLKWRDLFRNWKTS